MSGSSGRLRAGVDTTLFISGVIIKRGNPYALRQAWERQALILIISPEQRDEVEDVINRPKIAGRYRLTQQERDALLRRIDEEAEIVPPLATLPLSVRDLDDEPVPGTALAAAADYLVTGDEDLLVLRDAPRLGTFEIVTVAKFLSILEQMEREGEGSQ